MTDSPTPHRDRDAATVLVCEGCRATLGWLVRIQAQQMIVRSPRAKLLLFSDGRWGLSCAECGVRWRGFGAGQGSPLLVA